MQHVMYMNITEQQMQGLSEDEQTEMMVPYKEGSEVKEDGVKLYPFYIESHSSGIVTYTPAEGKVPELENEIAVDRQLWGKMRRQGQNWNSPLQTGGGKALWSAAYWSGIRS